MNSSSNPKPSTPELLERGRLKLKAIEFQERVAIFRAASASLKAAMIQAENGNAETLRLWLDQESDQFSGENDLAFPSVGKLLASEFDQTAQLLRIDAAHDSAQTEFVGSSGLQSSDRKSPWEIMEKSALKRIPSFKPETIDGLKPDCEPMGERADTEIDSLKGTDTSTIDETLQIKFTKPKDDLDPSGTLESGELSKSETEQPIALGFTLAYDPKKDDRNPRKLWWMAPHVLGSFGVHALLVAVMSLFAIHAKSATELLSIVSSSVEAENVLLETPMETISELEATLDESEPVQTPSLSNMVNDLSVPLTSLQTELGAGPTQVPSVAAEVAGSATDFDMLVGSKLLAGAEFFGVKATGNTFVYIVDSSPSMRRDNAFEFARQEILRSLSSMKPKQRFFVSFFGKEIDPMVLEPGVIEKYPIYANPENLTKTTAWMRHVQIQKLGWPPTDALAEAIGMQPDGIFLLFDGDTKVDVPKHLRRINRSDDLLTAGMPKVPVHVIHFFQDEFQKQMRQIAEENAGTYRFVPRPERPSKSNR